MKKIVHFMAERWFAKCDFCSEYKTCRQFVVVHGLAGFTEKKLCQDCEDAGRHRSDINDMNLSNAMKDDLDGYPEDLDD